ncbi:hypothetical protein [Nocardiopsis oceani]
MKPSSFSSTVFGGACVAMMILSTAPAHAETAPETAGDAVSFGVFATGEELPEDTFALEELENLGVDEADIGLLADGVVPDVEEQEPTQADDVLSQWDDVEGDTVIWRQGHYNPSTGRGSGAEKIDQKHNLSMEAVRTVTRHPFTNASPPPNHTKEQEQPPGGTTYRYRAEVWEVECTGWFWWRECQVLDTRTVRAIVDFRIPSHSTEPMGAFNAYCEQTGDRCPDWVRGALNI